MDSPNTLTPLQLWSDRLLDRLLEYRAQHPGFTFALRQVNRYGRLDHGQWFQGDDWYIFIGFTARGDEDNKTRSLGLVFTDLNTESAQCRIEVVFRTEPMAPLVAMYRHLVAIISGFYKPNQPYYDGYKYFKDYPAGDPLANLNIFLATDWQAISQEVKQRDLGGDFFVQEVDFVKHLSRIQQLRGRELPLVVMPDTNESEEAAAQPTDDEPDGQDENLSPRPGPTDVEVIDESSTPAAGGPSADDGPSSDITDPIDVPKIDIRSNLLTLHSLINRLKRQQINLYPEYQRLPGLWNAQRMSQLIESILIRIPIPAFYFDGSSEIWEVVDGLQRLSTLKRFAVDQGDLALRLTGLDYLREYNGKTFAELPLFLQTRIEETQVMVYVINPGTPDLIKFNIFKRINTGGLILTPQEIRNALNQGTPARTVKELAGYEEFKLATGGRIPTERMEDGDFVTRFIGFYHGYQEYQPDLDTWLHKGLARLSELSEPALQTLKNDFKKAMLAAHDLFGEEAFRKRYRENDRRKPINKALFDTWAVNLAQRSPEEIKRLVQRRKRLANAFMKVMNTEEFDVAVSRSTGDVQSVKRRFERIREIIQSTLQD